MNTLKKAINYLVYSCLFVCLTSHFSYSVEGVFTGILDQFETYGERANTLVDINGKEHILYRTYTKRMCMGKDHTLGYIYYKIDGVDQESTPEISYEFKQPFCFLIGSNAEHNWHYRPNIRFKFSNVYATFAFYIKLIDSEGTERKYEYRVCSSPASEVQHDLKLNTSNIKFDQLKKIEIYFETFGKHNGLYCTMKSIEFVRGKPLIKLTDHKPITLISDKSVEVVHEIFYLVVANQHEPDLVEIANNKIKGKVIGEKIYINLANGEKNNIVYKTYLERFEGPEITQRKTYIIDDESVESVCDRIKSCEIKNNDTIGGKLVQERVYLTSN